MKALILDLTLLVRMRQESISIAWSSAVLVLLLAPIAMSPVTAEPLAECADGFIIHTGDPSTEDPDAGASQSNESQANRSSTQTRPFPNETVNPNAPVRGSGENCLVGIDDTTRVAKLGTGKINQNNALALAQPPPQGDPTQAVGSGTLKGQMLAEFTEASTRKDRFSFYAAVDWVTGGAGDDRKIVHRWYDTGGETDSATSRFTTGNDNCRSCTSEQNLHWSYSDFMAGMHRGEVTLTARLDDKSWLCPWCSYNYVDSDSDDGDWFMQRVGL